MQSHNRLEAYPNVEMLGQDNSRNKQTQASDDGPDAKLRPGHIPASKHGREIVAVVLTALPQPA